MRVRFSASATSRSSNNKKVARILDGKCVAFNRLRANLESNYRRQEKDRMTMVLDNLNTSMLMAVEATTLSSRRVVPSMRPLLNMLQLRFRWRMYSRGGTMERHLSGVSRETSLMLALSAPQSNDLKLSWLLWGQSQSTTSRKRHLSS